MNYVLNTSLASVDSVPTLRTPEDAIKGGLAEDLLWYERVVIVTSTFHELKYLIKWMSIDRIVEMVELGELGFLRVPSVLAYVGETGRRQGGLMSGPGLVALRGQGPPHPEDWREQMYSILRESLPIGHRRAEKLVSALTGGVEDTNPSSYFAEAIQATRTDVSDAKIAQFIGLGDADDIDDLPPNDAKIQRLLRVGVANLDLLLAAKRGNARLHADPIVKELLEGKIHRLLPHAAASAGIDSLLELKNLPSVAESVRTRSITFDQIITARRSDNGRRFREWLDVAVAGDDDKEAAREYLAAIESSGAAVPLTAKIARFVIVTGLAGMLAATAGPAAGLALGAFDALILDRLAESWTPRAFLDDELATLLG